MLNAALPALLACIIGITLAALAGPYLPQGWHLFYAGQSPGTPYWFIYRIDISHNLAAPYSPGLYSFANVPVLSPDRRYVIRAQNFSLHEIVDTWTGDVVPIETARAWAWSPDSRRIAYQGRNFVAVFSVDAAGAGTRIRSDNLWNDDWHLAWSPVDSAIAFQAFFADNRTNYDIFAVNSDGSELRNVSSHPASDRYPVWSPDGARLAFVSTRDGNPDIYVVDAPGEEARSLAPHRAVDRIPVWSSDGTRLAFVSYRHGTPALYVIGVDGGQLIGPLARYIIGAPMWSPDDNWLIYVSGQDNDVYRVSVAGGQPYRLTNNALINVLLP